MEIRWRKDDNKIKKQTDINRHGPKPSSNSSQPPNPPPFSLSTTFKTGQQLGSATFSMAFSMTLMKIESQKELPQKLLGSWAHMIIIPINFIWGHYLLMIAVTKLLAEVTIAFVSCNAFRQGH